MFVPVRPLHQNRRPEQNQVYSYIMHESFVAVATRLSSCKNSDKEGSTNCIEAEKVYRSAQTSLQDRTTTDDAVINQDLTCTSMLQWVAL